MVGLYSTLSPPKWPGTHTSSENRSWWKNLWNTLKKIISFYEIKQNSGGKNEKGSALKCFPYSIWWCTNCFISPVLRTGHVAMKKVYLKKRLFLVLVVKFSNRSYHDQYQNWLLEGIITTVTMKTKSLIIKRYRKCLDAHSIFICKFVLLLVIILTGKLTSLPYCPVPLTSDIPNDLSY